MAPAEALGIDLVGAEDVALPCFGARLDLLPHFPDVLKKRRFEGVGVMKDKEVSKALRMSNPHTR